MGDINNGGINNGGQFSKIRPSSIPTYKAKNVNLHQHRFYSVGLSVNVPREYTHCLNLVLTVAVCFITYFCMCYNASVKEKFHLMKLSATHFLTRQIT